MNVDYLQIKLKELKLFLEVKYKAKTSLDVERLFIVKLLLIRYIVVMLPPTLKIL